nr:phosphatase IMPL1, chloroplastic [Ipomoea batatas]
MGERLLSTAMSPLRFSHRPITILPCNRSNFPFLNANLQPLRYGFDRILSLRRSICAKAVMSEVESKKEYLRIGADSTGSIPSDQLLEIVQAAAKTGAEVVMDAVNKPRNINYKGFTDLVTDTDKKSELAILDVVRKNFPDHLVLGEEGGFTGDPSSDYLWCIDPLDGTTNFTHSYASFAVSVAILFRGKPAASTVVEFVGGPLCWTTRTYTAAVGKGAYANGQKLSVTDTDKVEQSLLVTGYGYDRDDSWATNMELFKEFTGISRVATFSHLSLSLSSFELLSPLQFSFLFHFFVW